MTELVYLKNDEAMTDSLNVAESFGKRHTHVLDKIEQILSGDSAENSAQCFKLSHYKDASGKMNKKYLMNRDGFTFLVMGFTGKKADKWKWNYIKAFNSMESIIRERATTTWIGTRQAGKVTRRIETDAIQRLVEYAKQQGSSNSNWLYRNYNHITNKAAGVTNRDEATIMQLNNVALMENIISCVINTEMSEGKYYKDIFQDCKARLETVSQLAYIGAAEA